MTAEVARRPHHSTGSSSKSSSGSKRSESYDRFYGHRELSEMCEQFITALFACPLDSTSSSVSAASAPVTPSGRPAPRLAEFIAYALHRTRLPLAVTHQALFLLRRLKSRFPAARGSSGHRLFISALMLASKSTCDDTYSNKSWTIVGQGLFSLREVNQMERELFGYLGYKVNVDYAALQRFVFQLDSGILPGAEADVSSSPDLSSSSSSLPSPAASVASMPPSPKSAVTAPVVPVAATTAAVSTSPVTSTFPKAAAVTGPHRHSPSASLSIKRAGNRMSMSAIPTSGAPYHLPPSHHHHLDSSHHHPHTRASSHPPPISAAPSLTRSQSLTHSQIRHAASSPHHWAYGSTAAYARAERAASTVAPAAAAATNGARVASSSGAPYQNASYSGSSSSLSSAGCPSLSSSATATSSGGAGSWAMSVSMSASGSSSSMSSSSSVATPSPSASRSVSSVATTPITPSSSELAGDEDMSSPISSCVVGSTAAVSPTYVSRRKSHHPVVRPPGLGRTHRGGEAATADWTAPADRRGSAPACVGVDSAQRQPRAKADAAAAAAAAWAPTLADERAFYRHAHERSSRPPRAGW